MLSSSYRSNKGPRFEEVVTTSILDSLTKLDRSFYQQNTLDVARQLIGRYLAHVTEEGTTVGRIVENEAYLGTIDPASHAYGGRRTARNEVLYGPAGHAYIYPIYGMYLCLNIVTGGAGTPEAVLLRALQPVEGLELMYKRRGIPPGDHRADRRLMSGPSKMCIAMGIERPMNGMDLEGDELFLSAGAVEAMDVDVAPRIGIDYAGEGRSWPWRFGLRHSPFVSRRLRP